MDKCGVVSSLNRIALLSLSLAQSCRLDSVVNTYIKCILITTLPSLHHHPQDFHRHLLKVQYCTNYSISCLMLLVYKNDLWSQCSVWHRLTTQTDIVPDFISCLIFSLFYALLCLYVCVLFAPFVQCTCNSLYIIHAESLQA